MNSEKVANILGGIVALAVLVIALAYGPLGLLGKPPKPLSKTEPAAQSATPPPAAPRGPVIREVPQ
jgi:hypothetical protein